MANIGFNRPVRYAVIGLGKFAQIKVLPSMAASANSEIIALVSGDKEKCDRLCQQYNGKYRYSYQQYDDCLANPDIDAVYIVLPNALHEEYTVRAAKAGKHILCEKPMATSYEAALRMVHAARDAEVKLMVGYRMHFEPTNRMLKEKIRSQELGSIKQFYSSFTFNVRKEGWRLNHAMAGGGVLVDIGIYPLNNVCWLLGLLPETVEAHTWSTDPKVFKEVEENITFRMTFSQGLEVQCMASYGVASSSQILVGGEKGWVELSQIYDYSDNPVIRQYSEETGELQENRVERMDEVKAEIEHFSQCIQENSVPEPTGEEGYRDHKLMTALYQSARLRQPLQILAEEIDQLTQVIIK